MKSLSPAHARAERTEQDRVAEPVDSAVSSPGAYLALGLLYTVAALPAIIAPQAVRVSFDGHACSNKDTSHIALEAQCCEPVVCAMPAHVLLVLRAVLSCHVACCAQ